MLSKILVDTILTHAEEIITRIVDNILTHPRTAYYHTMDRAELKKRVEGIFKNLGKALQEGSEAELRTIYLKFGKVRYFEGVPLSDLLYALIMCRRHMLQVLQKHVVPESSAQLYQEMQLHDRLAQFFDDIVYFATKGYQEACEETAGGAHIKSRLF
jgi:hypothetical protein